jgi:hypothetical protein
MDLHLRDLSDEAAIVTDRYLDALLAAGDRQATDAPSDALLHPTIREAARWLRDDLIRVHPSFRFEERLSAALARAAAGQRSQVAAGAEDVPISLVPAVRGATDGDAWEAFDPLGEAPLDDDWAGLSRPIIIGGAVASAAISVAGAAIVAWRLARGETDPMSRAVRAVNRLRADAERARLA